MFTGIVIDRGRVSAIERSGADLTLAIAPVSMSPDRLSVGDSISVQGVCLTVTRLQGAMFAADVSKETLDRTTLGTLRVGSAVNLEPALRAGDALGGHMVSGHIDGVARLTDLREDARSWRMVFEVPQGFARFLAPKGSICLDGVSLTVNAVRDPAFEVNIIPHTFAATTLGERRRGEGVNFEVDLIARYLDRLVAKT